MHEDVFGTPEDIGKAKAFAFVEGSHTTMTKRILEVYERAIGTSKGWADLSLTDVVSTARKELTR